MLQLIGFALVLAWNLPPTSAPAECDESDVYIAGVPDNFEHPAEPSFPSLELVTYAKTSWPQLIHRRFDDDLTDVALIHTFSGWKGSVCGATLEIRLRAGGNVMSTNDSVRLELTGGDDHQRAFAYWTTIRNVTGSWGPGDEATLLLDLGNLPRYVDFPTDILPTLQDGDLDLLVEDDTAIDYAILRICECASSEGRTPVEATSWGRLKTSYR